MNASTPRAKFHEEHVGENVELRDSKPRGVICSIMTDIPINGNASSERIMPGSMRERAEARERDVPGKQDPRHVHGLLRSRTMAGSECPVLRSAVW